MESYVNKDTIITNQIYEMFESSVICSLCKNIYIKPVMCIKCQNVYCQRCIDNWNKNEKKCPNNCEVPEYNNCIAKNEILSKLKFTCVGCNKEIDYNNAENHHELCCPGKTSSDMIKTQITKSKFKKLTADEINELKNKGEEMIYITGMKK